MKQGGAWSLLAGGSANHDVLEFINKTQGGSVFPLLRNGWGSCICPPFLDRKLGKTKIRIPKKEAQNA